LSLQRLVNSKLSHSAALFGKVVEHDHHLVAGSLPVCPDSLANLAACKYLKYRVYCATVGFRTDAAAHPTSAMTQESSIHTWLPPERAFVVHLYADTPLEKAHMAGRVEHVLSGQAEPFHSLATLPAFMTRVLGEGETSV
jgi:hypothetical protein